MACRPEEWAILFEIVCIFGLDPTMSIDPWLFFGMMVLEDFFGRLGYIIYILYTYTHTLFKAVILRESFVARARGK